MNYLLPVIFLGLLIPLVSHGEEGLAVTENGATYTMTNVTITNSGSIQSKTSSSASTGGNSVGSAHSTGSGQGGTVQTGDAKASATTEIHSDGGKGTVEVTVSTETNGEKKTETYKKDLEPGETVDVQVSATSDSAKGESKVQVRGWDAEKKESVSKEATTTATSTTPVVSASTSASATIFTKVVFKSFFANIGAAFKSFVSIFAFW